MMGTDFTATEQEVIVLKAVWELIGEMVNYEMFTKFSSTNDVLLTPATRTHQRLFNILLVDFLSKPKLRVFGLPDPPNGPLKSEQSYLFYLRRICDAPKLNPTGGNAIRTPLNAFVRWLETECFVEKVWLPSIGVEANIKLKRILFIKICGNIAKHSFARLNIDVEEITKVLQANGVTIDIDQGYLVIPDFYEWFHTNILNYHISALAEFLNNIRWGIYEYLRPEFERLYTRDSPTSVGWRFTYPPDCNRPIAQAMYWDLMNEVRSEPYMPKFEITRYLKMRY
jgi:hypothetical protein